MKIPEIFLEAECLVTYNCYLTTEDSEKVLKYADDYDLSIQESLNVLHENGEIEIFDGIQSESDCSTQSVKFTKLNYLEND